MDYKTLCKVAVQLCSLSPQFKPFSPCTSCWSGPHCNVGIPPHARHTSALGPSSFTVPSACNKSPRHPSGSISHLLQVFFQMTPSHVPSVKCHLPAPHSVSPFSAYCQYILILLIDLNFCLLSTVSSI